MPLLRTYFLSLLASSVSAIYTPLQRRSDCKVVSVVSGDSCGTLASRCGISAQDFTNFNSDPNLCSTLALGGRVCCSAGSLPDITPKTGSDGVCATYTVKDGDSCSSIAAANGLKLTDLSKFNDGASGTWGWSGCETLMRGVNICLSKGTAPMPAPVDNAVCGPTVKNTVRNASLSLAAHNPCPLNACCNIWGQCGTTPEFCTYKQAKTNNPGTTPPGISACVNSCDCDNPVSRGAAPASFIQIGYYESWNFDRSCLNMRVTSVDTDYYTHVHWAFGAISSKDFSVVINDTSGQWPLFVGMKGVKKILSIGGWGCSTDLSTYDILRVAMTPANADSFASKLNNFVMEEGLDGIDIDWEYPGADVPGVPKGLASDGPNYLTFLRLLRSKLRSDKTLSIAAPASFWYLKNFPIGEMASVVDYIVYMTYDLHGQWDYGNKYSQDGCSNGDCLRSHANLTETMYALTMITKAGAPTDKVVVGMPSYGRSFAMSQAGCDGPMCHYQGPDSVAQPGQCTSVPGILANAEIEDIIINDLDTDDNSTRTWYDLNSNTNILVYNNTQWVAFIDETTRASRKDYYKSMNFLGTVDWAMDLREWHYEDESDPLGTSYDVEESLPPTTAMPNCDASFDNLEALNSSISTIPKECKSVYVLQTLLKILDDSTSKYQTLMDNDYDDKFQTYAQYVSDGSSKTVESFMMKNGSTYFTCLVEEATICCDKCASTPGVNECKYCNQGPCTETYYRRGLGDSTAMGLDIRDGSGGNGAKQRLVLTVQNISEPCPPDYSQRGRGTQQDQTVWWDMIPEQSDHFYADLLTSTGIPKDKTTIGAYNRGNACAPSAKPGDGDICWQTGYDYGIPVADGYSKADVSNPKDIVSKALGSSVDLRAQLAAVVVAVRVTAYIGDVSELIDAVSIPILMISDGVESMQKVETKAEELDEAKKKEIIMAFLTALLIFIPVAGEVLSAVTGIAEISTVLVWASVAGDVALGVQSLVEDPAHPLMGIISIILAPMALANLGKLSEAAELRRGMSDQDIGKLGNNVVARLKVIRKLSQSCNR